jgi:hypothetical protein
MENLWLTPGTVQNLIINIGHNHGVFFGSKIGELISQQAHIIIQEAF